MPYANVSQDSYPARLYYEFHEPEEVKSGNLVMFIHGFLSEGHFWKPQIDHFVSRGYRVLTFDNRGIGRSTHTLGRYTTSQLARDALDLLCQVGYSPKQTHLIAQSLGGMIGIELLAQLSEGSLKRITRDDSFLSCILMVTQSLGWFQGGFPPFDLETMMVFIKVGLPWLSSLTKMDAMNSLTFSEEWRKSESDKLHHKTNQPLSNRASILHHHIEQYKMKKEENLKAEKMFGSYRGLFGHITATATHNVTDDRLKAIKTKPILLITSTNDRWVRVSNQEHLAKSSLDCRHLKMPNSSHGVNVERATEVSAEMEAFITEAEQHANPAEIILPSKL